MNDFLTRQTYGVPAEDDEFDRELAAARTQDSAQAADEALFTEQKAAIAGASEEEDRETSESFIDGARDFIGKVPENVTKGTYQAWTNTLDLFVNRHLRADMQGQLNKLPGVEEMNDSINAFFDSSDATTGDRITQKLSQFLVPFMGYTKILAASNLGPIATGMVADAMASISALDVHETRLADLAKDLGVENGFIDYLASDGGSDAENRLRNMLDSVLASGAATALFSGAKGMWTALREADNFGVAVGPAAQRGGVKLPGPKSSTRAIVSSDVKRGAKPKDPLVLEAKTPQGRELIESADEAADGILAKSFDDFDVRPEVTHQVNFDRIETSDDVKAVIAETAERFKGNIDEARRGKIANEQLEQMAEELHTTPDTIRRVMEREAGDSLTPEMVVASRKVLHDSAARLQGLAKRIQVGDATDIEKLSFRRQMAFHASYQTNFMGARAEVGRALQAFNIPLGSSETGMKQLQGLVETFSAGNIDDIARRVASFDDIGQLNKFTKEVNGSKAVQVLREIYINSILSGVKTQVVNMTGNGLFQGMNIAERSVAARLGKFLPGTDHVAVGEAQAQLYGATSGLRDAFRLAWKTLKHADADMTKLDRPFMKAISSENLELAGPLGRAVDYLGATVRAPTERAMAAGDELFKSVAYRGDIARQAYRQASKEGLGPEEMGKRIAEIMDNVTPKMQEEAETFALYSTFQLPGGPLSQGVQKIRDKVPGGWVVFPFVRTPGNILKEAGLRSPIAPLLSDFRRAVRTGGPERDMALARFGMGTGTATAVAAMTLDGTITGGGPSNFQARKALQDVGWQPYSVAIPVGGKIKYYSYQRAEPLGMIIGATADAAEIFSASQYEDELLTEDERITDITAAIIGGIAQNTLDKSYLSGLSEFFHALDEPDRYFSTWLKRSASGMVPYSSLRRDLSRVQDPFVREAWTLQEKLTASAGIPGYSESLPFKLNAYGDPMEHRSGDVLGIVDPFPTKVRDLEPTREEIVRLMDSTRRVPVTMPNKAIEGMRLTSQQYHDLINLSRKEIKVDGLAFEDQLSSLMRSPGYLLMPDDAKVEVVKDVQRKYDKAARQMLEREDADLAADLLERRIIKQQKGL